MMYFVPSLVVVCGLLMGGGALAGDRVAGPVAARVLEVVDGDTLKVEAQIWPGHVVVTRVRLAGVDAPEEARAKCDGERVRGVAARLFLTDAVGGGAVRLADIRPGKFGGRVIASVRDAAGRDLSQLLIGQGHGRAYHGAKRDTWCAGAQETAFSRRPFPPSRD